MSADTRLDIEVERQHPDLHGSATLREIYDAVRWLKEHYGLCGSELRPGDCRVPPPDVLPGPLCQPPDLSGDPSRQVPLPALWNSLGMLECAAGRYDSAAAFFRAAAASLPEGSARGQVWFNAFLNAQLAGKENDALAALEAAEEQDRARFSLFPRDRYQVQHLLGCGGFGVVFLCLDRRTDRPVVVKSLHAELLSRAVPDVFHEAAILSELNHPAIVRLVDHGYADAGQARPFLVVEYFDGLTLHDYVARHGSLSVENLIVVARLIAEALQAAHYRGIWHRDVKPSNILLRCDRSGWQVKLIDFGAALRHTSADESTVPVGTAGYAAPEQMGTVPGAAVGAHTDVYGFGRTCCYALFANPKAFFGSNRSNVPPALAALLARCLEEQPENRFRHFGQVLTQLPDVRRLTESKASPTVGAPASEAPSHLEPQFEEPPTGFPPPSYADSGVMASAPPPRTAPPGEVHPLGTEVFAPQSPRTRVGSASNAPMPSIPPRRPRPGMLRRFASAVGGWFKRRGVNPADHLSDKTDRDNVDCTVFAPPDAHGGDTLLVQVFAHLPEQAETARQKAVEFDEQARARGFKSLEIDIERGSVLVFHLELPGFQIDEPVQALTWRGRTEAVSFAVVVPAEQPLGAVIGVVYISQDGVPIGRIRFKLLILAAAQQASGTPAPCGDEITRYQMVFVSYASHDRDEVLKRVQMLRRLKINCFQDVLNLEPGDRWEKELYRYIDRSDLFLLFWSTSARASEWVMKEVRYALERQGGRVDAPPAIMPVIIEGPPIPPPPPELEHLHFNDQILNFLSRPAQP